MTGVRSQRLQTQVGSQAKTFQGPLDSLIKALVDTPEDGQAVHLAATILREQLAKYEKGVETSLAGIKEDPKIGMKARAWAGERTPIFDELERARRFLEEKFPDDLGLHIEELTPISFKFPQAAPSKRKSVSTNALDQMNTEENPFQRLGKAGREVPAAEASAAPPPQEEPVARPVQKPAAPSKPPKNPAVQPAPPKSKTASHKTRSVAPSEKTASAYTVQGRFAVIEDDAPEDPEELVLHLGDLVAILASFRANAESAKNNETLCELVAAADDMRIAYQDAFEKLESVVVTGDCLG